MYLNISNTFNKELPADSDASDARRKVFEAAFSYVNLKQPSNPKLIHVSNDMLVALGVDEVEVQKKEFLDVFSGNTIYPNSNPYAMAYAGHQFGNWAGQLGDGRAINLFEIIHNKKRWAIQLKGAGSTPYSRQGDGLAVLRSSIREYLCSEAMYHLGVPTTRALSLMLSGDKVLRDILYNGNADYEKGAIVTRVAPSFIRFGNFELFAARKDHKNLKALADYTIKYFYPEIGKPSKETYITFFKSVTERTLKMILQWQRVGFVHGVMNTDNMSILGLTIDYGPYGWLEGFDFGWTPNTTDAQYKRYRYGNQPNIGLWNLYQLANALYPLIEEAEPLETILNAYKTDFDIESLDMMRFKLGLELKEESDKQLIADLEDHLLFTETDMTIFYRELGNYKIGDVENGLNLIKTAIYNLDDFSDTIVEKWKGWFKAYDLRLRKETKSNQSRHQMMNTVNPKYVLRNYMAQLAIDKADEGDYSLIETFYNMLKRPYDEQPEYKDWYAKRPEWARHKVGCSMLSCSS